VNKYSYVTARYLPPFHDFKTRLVYREIETVNSAAELNHRAARAAITHLGLADAGLEVMHAADLPGRSGTGSSSTFVVGLLHALSALRGRYMAPHELAAAAIDIEQRQLGETVGCQDQTWAAYGGLNVILLPQGRVGRRGAPGRRRPPRPRARIPPPAVLHEHAADLVRGGGHLRPND
jgi:D-glycero-alpha-D-manno-heptose-7-phosphate kinase